MIFHNMYEEKHNRAGVFVVFIIFITLALLTGFIHPLITAFLIPIIIWSTLKFAKEEKARVLHHNMVVQIRIPQKAKFVTFVDGHSSLARSMKHFVWCDNAFLFIFPEEYPKSYSKSDVSKIELVRVPLVDVEYYTTHGDFYTETTVSGGDGGGVSVTGAVVGSMLGSAMGGKTMGAAGAVIGSRKKVNAVKSETMLHDTRVTMLFYNDAGETRSLKFRYEDYDTFYRLLPDKSYEAHVFRHMNGAITKESHETIGEKLKMLKKLADEELISPQEFETSKKALLDKM
ncbi:hypothetical protein [Paenibacillus polymyxa]|uniref:M1-355 n=1 Tax=Paenibacillus polymyxa (strain SC2) TaxID=886882 RepID=A0A0D5ZBL7_PAEPS|nr:hypothetical protein [Paenibacillus polymyxa]AKA44175.1 M1-355 [Paenibacillus polymyxa SC2]WPQ57127.1 hypothetical protein SKN87_01110 [Paenibacillus polymyxa]CCC83136.1 hypothetical protein PPM_0199 [Paenibacillus polymyxa M1]